MNRPSRNDDCNDHPGWNQSPPALSGDLTTRSDLNGIANSRSYHSHKLKDSDANDLKDECLEQSVAREGDGQDGCGGGKSSNSAGTRTSLQVADDNNNNDNHDHDGRSVKAEGFVRRTVQVLAKYGKFIGPGAMVSVAYIDPGNYATDVSAGATYRFKLLFMVLVSNIFAIFLQGLCIKLGSVTGMNLAQMCKAHLPPWLNYTLYAFAEAAIIATDIAEVIGTAIALNLLFHIPLVAGCAISIVDVLVILFFYRPSGSVRGLRYFELFVMALVFAVVICFCFQLSLIQQTSVGEVFRGYLPSSALVQSQGIYQACGILGATVMPHSLYLGSGMVQPRLLEYDKKHSTVSSIPYRASEDSEEAKEKSTSDMLVSYRPSLAAIKACMSYSMAELAISLFTFALFVNSAILVIAGASLSNTSSSESTSSAASSGNLFTIHKLLSDQLSPAAGTVFALSLLLSGTSAGIICTIAGQMISEGQLSLQITPWIRRLITRSVAITPAIIIAGAVGQEGLSKALEASQVALSVILPFVSAPVLYFTCCGKYMAVNIAEAERPGSADNDIIRSHGSRNAEPNERDASTRDLEPLSADLRLPTVASGTEEKLMSSVATAPGPSYLNIGLNETPAGLHRLASAPIMSTELSSEARRPVVQMRNHWITAVLGALIWGVIVLMNVAALVLLGLGKN